MTKLLKKFSDLTLDGSNVYKRKAGGIDLAQSIVIATNGSKVIAVNNGQPLYDMDGIKSMHDSEYGITWYELTDSARLCDFSDNAYAIYEYHGTNMHVYTSSVNCYNFDEEVYSAMIAPNVELKNIYISNKINFALGYIVAPEKYSKEDDAKYRRWIKNNIEWVFEAAIKLGGAILGKRMLTLLKLDGFLSDDPVKFSKALDKLPLKRQFEAYIIKKQLGKDELAEAVMEHIEKEGEIDYPIYEQILCVGSLDAIEKAVHYLPKLKCIGESVKPILTEQMDGMETYCYPFIDEDGNGEIIHLGNYTFSYDEVIERNKFFFAREELYEDIKSYVLEFACEYGLMSYIDKLVSDYVRLPRYIESCLSGEHTMNKYLSYSTNRFLYSIISIKGHSHYFKLINKPFKPRKLMEEQFNTIERLVSLFEYINVEDCNFDEFVNMFIGGGKLDCIAYLDKQGVIPTYRLDDYILAAHKCGAMDIVAYFIKKKKELGLDEVDEFSLDATSSLWEHAKIDGVERWTRYKGMDDILEVPYLKVDGKEVNHFAKTFMESTLNYRKGKPFYAIYSRNKMRLEGEFPDIDNEDGDKQYMLFLVRSRSGKDNYNMRFNVLDCGVENDKYLWAYVADYGVVIVKYIGSDEVVDDIPMTIQGRPVVAIGMSAFCEKNITELVLPDGITAIESYAFFETGCYDLICPPSLKIIGANAFGLNTMPKLDLGNVEYIDESAFVNAEIGTPLVISRNTKHIGVLAFYGCRLNKVYIPKEVEFIGKDAFELYGRDRAYVEASVQPIGWDPHWLGNIKCAKYGSKYPKLKAKQ